MNITLYPPQTAIVGYILNYPIRFYGLIMAFAFFVGIIVGYFLISKKYGKNEAELFFDYSPALIVFSIIGARIFYVLASFNYYFYNPKEIFMINHGGISIIGAIIFGFISIFALSKIKSFDFKKHLDVISIVLPLCQAIGRFGNYFNQEAYGKPTDGFIKLFVDKQYRYSVYSENFFFHPTFLYESVLDILIFVLLMVIFFKTKLKNGSIACLYLILYSSVRYFIETIRIDSVLNIGNFSIAQIFCVIFFILGIIFLVLNNKKHAL